MGLGMFCAIVAGMMISLQTVLNARMSHAFGAWATTTLVFFVGLLGSLLALVFFRGGEVAALTEVEPLYLFGGFVGVGVVFCVMRGIQLLGPSIAISVVLISQLSFALCVDVFGWFGLPKVELSFGQIIGLAVMLSGIFVLKRYQVVDESNQTDEIKAIS
ncbi:MULTISPECIES: DMT family transporter [unclassified Exiguobacterium]|uniref:DMT family transporter n=1 Tax=unclassified Exiguobacterium TaxID=2644629 RepID=UPI000DF7DA97|nr:MULTISPECIES: DMT family transporter [unclassified Exiguobacterium]RDB32573.1 DMT family transporter [Exiguobacterium sp. RIT594]